MDSNILQSLIHAALENGDTPNDLQVAFEDILAAEATLREWIVWGDGRWRLDTVCSICGSELAGICGSSVALEGWGACRDKPGREIILRSEYEWRLSTP